MTLEKPISELINFSVINLDKPSGPTSYTISNYIKKSIKLNKTSHGGTLDPQVSGVLPIFTGRACRLMDYFLHKDKTYVGIMRLHKSNISDEKLKEAMSSQEGRITQLPPIRSRVKRAERIREVKKFQIIERNDKDVLFIAEVQAGTYIRRLCDEVGKQLGGAHMFELRRTKAGIFTEEDSSFANLYDFEEALKEYEKGNSQELKKILIPAELAIKNILPTIQLSKTANLKQILTGKPLMKHDLESIPKDEIFAVFQKDKFIEIAKKTTEDDIIARPEFVFN